MKMRTFSTIAVALVLGGTSVLGTSAAIAGKTVEQVRANQAAKTARQVERLEKQSIRRGARAERKANREANKNINFKSSSGNVMDGPGCDNPHVLC